MRKNRLKWFGHIAYVMRGDDSETMRVVMEINVSDKMSETLKKRWIDGTDNDMRMSGVNRWEVGDRNR